MSFRAEVIIPFYNEAHLLDRSVGLIATALDESGLLEKGWQIRFWWVDDGSTDGSAERLQEGLAHHFPGAVANEILCGWENEGKGAAMRRAIASAKARTEPGSIVAFWDSDGELDPRALFEGLEIIATSGLDILFGSRFLDSKTNGDESMAHYLGNRALTRFSNALSGLKLSDVHCCARLMKAEVLFALPLKSSGFDFEAEFVALVARVKKPKLKIAEYAIPYAPRTVAQGKKIGLVHVPPQIFQALRCRYLQRPIHLRGI